MINMDDTLMMNMAVVNMDDKRKLYYNKNHNSVMPVSVLEKK